MHHLFNELPAYYIELYYAARKMIDFIVISLFLIMAFIFYFHIFISIDLLIED